MDGTSTSPAVASGPESKRLTGSLGVTAIVFMVVAAAAPLTVVGGVMPLGFTLGNGLGFPVMYIFASAVLTLFSVGLSQMARVVPKAGAFYTYIRHALGDVAGTAAAFIAVVAYICAPIGTAAYIGVQFDIVVTNFGGPAIPWWGYSAVIIAVVGVLGYRSIDLTARVLGIMLVGEVLVVVALAAVVFATGGESGYTAEPFAATSVFSGNLGIAMMFAITGFLGFEATAIYRDEARDPDRTIPRATYAAVIGIGAFYAISAYALVLAWGPDKVLDEAANNPASMLVTTTRNYLGIVGEIAAQTLLITSVFACILAFQNVIARYLHSMAGDNMLAAHLNGVHTKHGSPHRASAVMTIMMFVTTAACVVLGLDPTTQVLAWSSALIAAGVVILMILTSIAVPLYFYRTKTKGNVWATTVAPLTGMCGLLLAAILMVANFPFMVGGSPVLAYSLLGVFPVAALIGVIVALKYRPKQSDSFSA